MESHIHPNTLGTEKFLPRKCGIDELVQHHQNGEEDRVGLEVVVNVDVERIRVCGPLVWVEGLWNVIYLI